MINLHDGAGCSGSAQEPMPNEEPNPVEQPAPEQGDSGEMPAQQA